MHPRSGAGPTLNRSLAIQYFECGGVDKVTDGDGVVSISICDCHMYVFYQLTGANKTDGFLTHKSVCAYSW